MELLFDLDGTLTDPEEGITRCIGYALDRLGREAPEPREALRRYIGPPLRASFAELLGTEDPALVEEAVALYRERFATTGLFENAVYPDVPAGLARLRDAGHRLWVATSKPQVYAQRIVEHFGLAPLFERVHGSELGGARTEKTDLVAYVLAAESLDPGRSCMIGDRWHDVAGGRANRTRTVGVLWGYGSEDELRRAAPDGIVASMRELVALVLGDDDGARASGVEGS